VTNKDVEPTGATSAARRKMTNRLRQRRSGLFGLHEHRRERGAHRVEASTHVTALKSVVSPALGATPDPLERPTSQGPGHAGSLADAHGALHRRSESSRRIMRMLGYGAYMSCLYAVVCGLLLATTNSTSLRLFVPMILGVVAVTGAAVAHRAGSAARAGSVGRPLCTSQIRKLSRSVLAVIGQLTPMALLAGVFPVVGGRLHEMTVGGTPLSSVLMAGSVTAPLLAQIACAPLYRALGEDVYNKGSSVLVSSFLARWPGVLLRSVPLAGVMSLPFAVATAWPLSALMALALFNLCSLMMVQWFVVPIMQRRYGLWAAAWVGYALLILVAPQACLVAPLAALAVLAAATVRRSVIARPRSTHGVLPAFLRGALQGTLVWLNPFLLLLTAGQTFQPKTAFLALLPAVLLFNIYFVSLATGLQSGFAVFQNALHGEPLSRMRTTRDRLTRQVGRKFAALVVMLVAAMAVSIGLQFADPTLSTSLYVALTACSIGFCLESILVYDLIQVKRDWFALGLSAVHMTAFAVTMIVWSPSALFYTINTIVEVFVVLFLALAYAREIAEPDYATFWRHATGW
jgi:hypothetical protein